MLIFCSCGEVVFAVFSFEKEDIADERREVISDQKRH
jgi:hypothetical protein